MFDRFLRNSGSGRKLQGSSGGGATDSPEGTRGLAGMRLQVVRLQKARGRERNGLFMSSNSPLSEASTR
eukprot:5553915-Amphidinium_carterae.1